MEPPAPVCGTHACVHTHAGGSEVELSEQVQVPPSSSVPWVSLFSSLPQFLPVWNGRFAMNPTVWDQKTPSSKNPCLSASNFCLCCVRINSSGKGPSALSQCRGGNCGWTDNAAPLHPPAPPGICWDHVPSSLSLEDLCFVGTLRLRLLPFRD